MASPLLSQHVIDLTFEDEAEHTSSQDIHVLKAPSISTPLPSLSSSSSHVLPPSVPSISTPTHHSPRQHTSKPAIPAPSPTSGTRLPYAPPLHHGQSTHIPAPSVSPSFSLSPPLQDDARPAKRRRVSNEATPISSTPAPDKSILKNCLDRQVFPHLDRATAQLDRDVYDLDRLGRKVSRTVADKQFERHFLEGRGQLSAAAEAAVASRVQNLVDEFARGGEFLRHPAVVSDLPPSLSIRPSVESLQNGGIIREESVAEEQGFVGRPEISRRARFQARTPPPPLRPKKKPLVTPQRLRARAKATQWQSGRAYETKKEGSPLATQSRWFGLSSRPYMKGEGRELIAAGARKGRSFPVKPGDLDLPAVFHVDFGDGEVKYLQCLARALYGRPVAKAVRTILQDLRHIIKKVPDMRLRLVAMHRKGYDGYDVPPYSITKRSAEDISNFLDDLYCRKVAEEPESLFVERVDSVAQSDTTRANRVPSLLLTREIAGNRVGTTRRYQNYTTAFRSNQEDYLEPKVEWTNCAGDIMTLSWLSNTDFICGTTTHSDSHNQQYNKPGNLLLGSAKSNTLRAYPDHRIVRPVVAHGDNALDSMRESQDPWLYTSVVSSDYEPSANLAFTSSFDKTVKIWQLNEASMTAVGTWHHDGRVNFVVASKNESGTIATAADVPTEAVRVYHLNSSNDVSACRFDSYSCTRVHDEDYVPFDKWAYYPAAIRWGLSSTVRHLLLIGYSPRSPTGEDHEIPEDKRGSGELCLWNTVSRTQVKVNSAKTQNVFEVAWHPSRPSFAAATSATQTLEKMEAHVRTQIRIFELNETGQYGAIKTLDCSAVDINEITIKPNSILFSYVAAGCTDGKVYVWDTAGSDRPMCTLEHGDPVEELLGDREQEDVGVKFIAWGTTADRFYTGSSDGVVKVWNIRHGKGVHVKDLIEVAAPITFGDFSPDFSKLAIGDGSGRVYLMALEDKENEEQNKSAAVSSGFLQLQLDGRQRAIRRPRPFIPHAEIPPPADHSDSSRPQLGPGQARAKEYLATSELILRPDPTVGVVQGANYPETGLFRAEAHLNGDANEPLLGAFENLQQANQAFARTQRILRQRLGVDDGEGLEMLRDLHLENQRRDFSKYADLDAADRMRLEAERAELDASAYSSGLEFDREDEDDDGSSEDSDEESDEDSAEESDEGSDEESDEESEEGSEEE